MEPKSKSLYLILSQKYRKQVAVLLFVTLFSEFAAPVMAKIIYAGDNSWNFYKRYSPSEQPCFPNFVNFPLFDIRGPALSDINKDNKQAIADQELNLSDKSVIGEFNEKDKVDIGGPGQPEMSGFKSVNQGDMVDMFSGSFSYNIPLMDVGGYPVNIYYNSGVSMDQEASWVGLGWNINPGTISRTLRGIPDDFNGTDSIAKTQSIKPNKTVGVQVGPDIEFFGLPINGRANLGIFHNNYNGWGIETGINASINVGSLSFGNLTGSLSLSNNSQTGLDVKPSIGVMFGNEQSKLKGQSSLSTNYNSRAGISGLQLNTEIRSSYDYNIGKGEEQRSKSADISWPITQGISFATPSYTPTISFPTTGQHFSFTAKIGFEKVGAHPSLYVSGYVSKQFIKPEDKKQTVPAIGYLYYSKSNGNDNAVLDFNREKELYFNYKTTPHIAIPQYSYDVYSISGEGTGGMFRPYRGDVGYISDRTLRTKSDNDRVSLDIGPGPALFHGGLDLNITDAYTQNGAWKKSNDLNSYIQFQSDDTTYQSVYFRNPGERTSNTQSYYDAIGDDALIRVKLSGSKNNIRASNAFVTYKNARQTGEILVSQKLVKKERDKRSQVISYLTADDARIYGLDTVIKSYKENSIPIGNCADTVTLIPRVDGKVRKSNHLSQITVLNADGRRYIYGLPAYNVEQKDVTFSVNKETVAGNISKGLTGYTPGLDNSVNNNNGKDNFFTQDSMPAYAHSFLLTGLVSSDYVDIRGDGITDDDLGDAIKFNHTRVYGQDNNYYEWRTPFDSNKANYDEGLKTYSRDDKGTYLYGKKEVWYLNSIESKTMIAVFKIDSNRLDVHPVKGENGGLSATKHLRKLDKIELYAKADLLKNGSNARPIKTVHFVYSYDLCKGYAGDTNTGKLTLDSIWFSYNGNEKGKLNPYVFRYHPDSLNSYKPKPTYNPSYNAKEYDRWGNYKDPANNPGGMKNSEFPYTVQDSIKASRDASVWLLTDILLPSGGHMKINYEANDYAFVQYKRASNLVTIGGIGSTPSQTPNKFLYSSQVADNYYVFINTGSPISNINPKADIRNKYLGNGDVIYFKIAVKMPSDKWGSGSEMIPVYGNIEDFDKVSGNDHRFWIKLKSVDGESPLARAAIQFLRLNLPSKAYPASELGDDIDLGAAVKMLASGFTEIKNSVNGFGNEVRKKGWCKEIDTTISFIRLTAPDFKKYGGGARVKRLEVYDNWNKMTGQRESVYGQEYNYTTSQFVNGDTLIISSGVASYEPMIGADENPFRTPIEYAEKLAPMAPVNNLFSENPIGESYYPSAMVGYSKVRVRTINAKAKSANGWDETEFFTSREFPTITEHTLLDDQAKKRYNPKLQNFLRINVKNHVTLSQGFKIELNDMNGKIKSQASYAETDSLNPIHYVRNYYKVENENVLQKRLTNTVSIVDSLNGHINNNGQIGKDVEVMIDMREQLSKTTANNISPNVDVIPLAFIIPVIAIPSMIRLPQKEEAQFRSVATVKVIQRYGILDSVIVIDKGSMVSTKNLIYDGETGEVVLSRTNNEFNDPIYNFSYPAYWAYSGMGVAYKNINAVFSNLRVLHGKLYYQGSRTAFPAERFFESGDEIQLKGKVRTTQAGVNCLDFEPGGGNNLPNKMWAIEALKGKEGDKGLYFIDESGRPLTGDISFMRVLRSGKRNILGASAGNIVCMGDPVREVLPGNFKIVFDSTTKVVNASAVTYKDLWEIKNSFYAKDSIVRVYRNFPNITLYPQQVSTKRLDINGAGHIREDSYVPNSKNIATSFDYIPSRACVHSRRLYTKSILQFDFSVLPKEAIINSANLSFYGRVPKDLWVRKSSGKGNIFCPKTYGYNWPNATTEYLGANSVKLKRITAPWNNSTPYQSFATTASHQVSFDYLNRTYINCRDLIQDVINNNDYGLMFEIEKQTPTSNSYETNYLDFCAGNETNVNLPNCEEDLKNPGLNCSCYRPLLDISYQAYVDSVITLCKLNVNDTATNPYRWGILGNWRIEKAYTYYHDRVESDATSAATDIRREGLIKSFSTFWKFTDAILKENADTTRWVWNSAMSRYNRKGFEIENYDPLGRYNAGLYGYNQTLPIAVSQNSQHKQSLFDGFEDYGYKTNNCEICDSTREFDFVKNYSGVALDQTQAHTGKYSLKINANSQSTLSLPLTYVPYDTLKPELSIQIDSTPVYSILVNGVGTGLTGTYTGRTVGNCSLFPSTNNYTINMGEMGPIDFNWGSAAPVAACNKWYNLTWKGKLQAPYTDNYRFYGLGMGGAFTVIINNTVVVSNSNGREISGPKIYLEAGKLYDIQLRYDHYLSSQSQVRLRWSRDENPYPSLVPQNNLYKDNMSTSDSAGSVMSNILYYCISANNVKPRNIVQPSLTLFRNYKVAISGWVKIDGDDCNIAPTPDGALSYSFDGSNYTALQKTGNRIEGWQRYESFVDVPWNTYLAPNFTLALKGVNSRNVFIDDVRIQPFNSNMKSYVYDPVTLRLMAELDENNYATLYEYDDDGTLIRVKKETEQGVMTIKETRSGLKKD